MLTWLRTKISINIVPVSCWVDWDTSCRWNTLHMVLLNCFADRWRGGHQLPWLWPCSLGVVWSNQPHRYMSGGDDGWWLELSRSFYLYLSEITYYQKPGVIFIFFLLKALLQYWDYLLLHRIKNEYIKRFSIFLFKKYLPHIWVSPSCLACTQTLSLP
jgi:hypothetical protein